MDNIKIRDPINVQAYKKAGNLDTLIEKSCVNKGLCLLLMNLVTPSGR